MENFDNLIKQEYQRALELKRIEESIYLKKFIDSLSDEYKSLLPSGDLSIVSVLDSLNECIDELKENPFLNYLLEAENANPADKKKDEKKKKIIEKYKKQLDQVKQKLNSIKSSKQNLSSDQKDKKVEVAGRIKKGESAKEKIKAEIAKLEGDKKAKDKAKVADLKSKEAAAYDEFAKLQLQLLGSKKKSSGEKNPKEKIEYDFNLRSSLLEWEEEYDELLDIDNIFYYVIEADEKVEDNEELKKQANEAKIKFINAEIATLQAKLGMTENPDTKNSINSQITAKQEEIKTLSSDEKSEGDEEKDKKVDPAALEAAKKKVEDAKVKLEAANKAKSELKPEATEDEKAAAEKAVTDAQTELDTANEELAKIEGKSPEETKTDAKTEPVTEPKDETEPEPEGEGKLDALIQKRDKLSEDIKKLKEDYSGIDFKVDPKKSRDVNAEILKARAEKYGVMSEIKSEEKESDKSSAYAAMSKAKLAEHAGYVKWKDIKEQIAQLSEAENTEEKKKLIQSAIESKIEELTAKVQFSEARKGISKDTERIDTAIKTTNEKIEFLKSKLGTDLEEDPTEDEAIDDSEDAEETKADKIDKVEDEGEEDTSKEDEEKKKAKIKQLEIAIEELEADLEQTLDAKNEEIAALMKQTNSKAGFNPFLRSLLTSQRSEARATYYNKIAQMSEGDKKSEYEKLASDAEKTAQDQSNELDKAEKTAEEKNPEKTQAAQDQIASAEKEGIDPSETEAGKAATKAEEKLPPPETSKVVPGNEPKKSTKEGETPEQYKIRMAEEKLKGMSIAWQKKQQEAADESDPEKKKKLEAVASKIEQNIQTAKEAIQSAKGKSNESTDNDIWAINVMLNIIENQINNFGNEDDFIYG